MVIKTRFTNMNYLLFLLFVFSNISVYAQSSYDWNEHNNAMDSIDWERAFFGVFILVFIFWTINLLSKRGLLKVDPKKEYKQPKKAYKVVGILPHTAEEMRVPCTPEEILEWGESKGFLKEYQSRIANPSTGSARTLRLDIGRIKLYFKCKEFHNSLKKGTVVECEGLSRLKEWQSSVPEELLKGAKVGEVVYITKFIGHPLSDKALVKFQDGSTQEIPTINLKKRVYF